MLKHNRAHRDKRSGGFPKGLLNSKEESLRIFPFDVWVPTFCSQRNWTEGKPQRERFEKCLEDMRSDDVDRKNSGAYDVWEHVSNLNERRMTIETLKPLFVNHLTVYNSARCAKILRASELVPLIEEAFADLEKQATEAGRNKASYNPAKYILDAIRRKGYLEALKSYPFQPTDPDEFRKAFDPKRVREDVQKAFNAEKNEEKKKMILGYLARLDLVFEPA